MQTSLRLITPRFLTLSLTVAMLLFVSATSAAAQDHWENYYRGGLRALQRGDLMEAELLLKSARLKAELEAEAHNPDALLMIIESLSGIALVLRQQGRPAEAEQTLKEQLQLLKSFRRGEDDPQTSMTLHNLGLMQFDQKKLSEAKETLRKAIELRRKHDPEPKRNLAIGLLSIGAIYFEERKIGEAEATALEARQIISKISPADQTPEDLAALMRSDHNLALVYVEQAKYEVAERHFKSAIAAMERLYGPTSPGLILYLNNYAKLLVKLNREDEAKALRDRAEKLKDQKSRFEVPTKPNS